MTCSNQTDDVAGESPLGDPEAQRMYESTNRIVSQVLIPGVCVFGMVGNLLNLAVMTRQLLQIRPGRSMEHSAHLCLLALTVSDLLFCVFVFPHGFLPPDDVFQAQGLMLTYRLYCAAVINMFILSSTLLTVAMSLERYIACCYPLRKNLYLTSSRIKYIISGTTLFCLVFNIPVFWRYDVVTLCAAPGLELEGFTAAAGDGTTAATAYNYFNTTDIVTGLLPTTESNIVVNSTSAVTNYSTHSDLLIKGSTRSSEDNAFRNIRTLSRPLSPLPSSDSPPIKLVTRDSLNTTASSVRYMLQRNLFMDSEMVDSIYTFLWLLVGNFIPLILLVFFNVCLFRVVYQSLKLRRQFRRQNQSQAKSPSTFTLLLIVLLFFILVAPSELVLHVSRSVNGGSHPKHKTVELILNLMQTVNFSINFILYCLINPHFRRTLKFIFMCGFFREKPSPTDCTFLNAESSLISNNSFNKGNVVLRPNENFKMTIIRKF